MKNVKKLLLALALLMPCSVFAQTESTIYTFLPNPPGPAIPHSDLIFDKAGNLYGASYYGSEFGYGTVFQLVPASGGIWTLNTLHQFVGGPIDGMFPAPGLTIDEKGNLYGTTWASGPGNYGVVFEVSPQSDGQWTESLPYYFDNGDSGGIPYGGVTLYKGALYGTASYGGANRSRHCFYVVSVDQWQLDGNRDLQPH
jgi:hypothetical protein